MKSFNVAELLNVPNLPEYISKVEAELETVLVSKHPVIAKPIFRLIKARSKRLRPSILMAIVDNTGLKIDQKVITCGVAIELVHIASLVHDDIVDHSNTRWGVKTVNAKEGVNTAIIIGDHLFSKANQQAAEVDQETAKVIAKTIELLCTGEIIEMVDEFNIDRSISSLLNTIEGKTAALMSATCKLAGFCAGFSSEDIEYLTSYGKSFGMLFQFVDDILDFLSSEKLMGKPVGNDVKEGVYNMPLLLALSDKSDKKIRQLISRSLDNDIQVITDELIANGSLEKAIILTHEYNILASKDIRNLSDAKAKDTLSKLPNEYMLWALGNLTQPKYHKFVKSVLSKL